MKLKIGTTADQIKINRTRLKLLKNISVDRLNLMFFEYVENIS